MFSTEYTPRINQRHKHCTCTMDKDTDWLREILRSEQLEDFYVRIRDELQITRLAHFDYVREDDLEKIGISKPAIRRLLHAIKRENKKLWAQKFWSKLFGTSSNSLSREVVRLPTQTESRTAHIISEQDITLQNVLGKGSFAVVRKGEWRMSDSGKTVPVAVKVLKNGVHDDFGREVAAMHRLHHHNLMKLYGVVFQPYMMVCELAPMGALLDYIKSQNGRVSLNYIAKWSEQVAAGMAYLARNRFLHRDLACRNILLSTLDLIKIGDFGLMRVLPDGEEFYVMDEKHRERVPFPWCAPESLWNKQFSLASDVWMFAVALWEMYSFGAEPWTDPQLSERGAQQPEFKPLSGAEIRQRIDEGQRLPAPGACPPDVYMLLMQCWERKPGQRPTFEGIQRYMESNKTETAVAALSYRARGRDEMTVEAGNEIVLIDKRPDLHRWKGQNQKTLDVGLFPSNILRHDKPTRIAGAAKLAQTKKKLETPSPSKKVHTPPSQSFDDSSVVLRNKRRTIESTQPHTTRAVHADSKHISYNKLINDRTAERQRLERAAHFKSLNQVKEGLLIDLNLPPTPKLSGPPAKTAANNISILDQPIDVPESNPTVDWGEPSTDSLPNYTQSRPHSLFTNLYETKSLDNLTFSQTNQTQSQPDPFDTSQCWPVTRPNYDVQGEFTTQNNISTNHTQVITQNNRYSTNSPATTTVSENLYTNTSAYVNSIVASNTGVVSLPNSSYNRYGTLPNNLNFVQNNSLSNNYGTIPNNTIVSNGTQSNNSARAVPNNTYSNVLSIERNTTKTIAEALTELSLDDRISESLNLRSSENIYANSNLNDAPSTSAEPNHSSNDALYNDMPIYGNFDVNPAQQQLILEQKDFYSKGSTSGNWTNGYDKNIYTPKNESEKLQNFSESLENSKNYSAVKYQNSVYGSSFNSASTSRAGLYDFVDDTASNLYSEINDTESVYGYAASYANRRMYDDVYETTNNTPRPHRPAPPRPYKPS